MREICHYGMSMKEKVNQSIKSIDQVKIPVSKTSFLKIAVLFLSAIEKILHTLKSKIFLTKNPDRISTLEPTLDPTGFDTLKPTKGRSKQSSFKLHEKVLSEIVNDEKT